MEVEYVTLPASDRRVIRLDEPALSDSRPFTFGGRPHQRVETTTSVMPQERYEALLLERYRTTAVGEGVLAEQGP